MMQGFGGAFGGIVFIFLLVAAIASIFIPFWVWRIRNESIETNKKLTELISLNRKPRSE